MACSDQVATGLKRGHERGYTFARPVVGGPGLGLRLAAVETEGREPVAAG